MTFLFLAEIATFDYFTGELTDVEFDLHHVEASTEELARTALRMMIKDQGRQVGKLQVEAVAKDDLYDCTF
jgi:hypothetical protein